MGRKKNKKKGSSESGSPTKSPGSAAKAQSGSGNQSAPVSPEIIEEVKTSSSSSLLLDSKQVSKCGDVVSLEDDDDKLTLDQISNSNDDEPHLLPVHLTGKGSDCVDETGENNDSNYTNQNVSISSPSEDSRLITLPSEELEKSNEEDLTCEEEGRRISQETQSVESPIEFMDNGEDVSLASSLIDTVDFQVKGSIPEPPLVGSEEEEWDELKSYGDSPLTGGQQEESDNSEDIDKGLPGGQEGFSRQRSNQRKGSLCEQVFSDDDITDYLVDGNESVNHNLTNLSFNIMSTEKC